MCIRGMVCFLPVRRRSRAKTSRYTVRAPALPSAVLQMELLHVNCCVRVCLSYAAQRADGASLRRNVVGEGSQTRSFCYVDDLVDGLIRLMNQAQFSLSNSWDSWDRSPVQTHVQKLMCMFPHAARRSTLDAPVVARHA